jgi:subtilase family serine protease
MKRKAHFFTILVFSLLLLTSCGSTQTIGQGTPSTTATTGRAPITDTCPTEPGLNTATCLTPQGMRQAYGLSSLYQKGDTGKGQTVIDIVSFGSPTLQEDMNVFDTTFHLPAVNLQIISPLKVAESGAGDKAGWAGETTLDVQIIHALAPDAKIVLLISPVSETEGTIGLPEFRQLEQYAIDHKLGNIVSHSWGASEVTLMDSAANQELKLWDDLLQKGTTQDGMTYFSSSGDNGATDYSDMKATKLSNVATTSFAADSPWVTSVGGTTLRNVNNSLSEVGWPDSGGGFSKIYTMPSYQKQLSATTQSQFQNRRGVPDVSAVADPDTGMAFYENGLWSQAGGTSASSPVWSAIMAVADQMAGHPLGFINPILYKIAASDTYNKAFHDITEGNNSNQQASVTGYDAVTGWDPITGLGTPDAENLIPAMIKDMT